MKYRFLLLLSSLIFAFSACNDDTSQVGFEVQPTEDRIEVIADFTGVTSKTVVLDSMFIRADTAFLGQYTDKYTGKTKVDFLSQVAVRKDFAWQTGINRPDSVMLNLYYSNYFGDSLATMNVIVYELNKKKLENTKSTYYTDIDPAEYCDFTKILGQKAFVPKDYAVDSVKKSPYYSPSIPIRLSDDLIRRFYDRYDPANFATTQAFTDFFKGFYVTTNFGDGAIMYIEDVYLQFYYTFRDSENDTIYAETFAYHKEVPLANRLVQDDISALTENDTINFIKTPIGALTYLSIPVKEIKDEVGDNPLNTVMLTLPVDQVSSDSELYSDFPPPQRLLLVKKDEVTSFFETSSIYDGKESFIATYDATNKMYSFNNISRLLQNTEEDIQEMAVIPVTIIIDELTSSASKVRPLYAPSFVRLKNSNSKNRPMKLSVVYSKF